MEVFLSDFPVLAAWALLFVVGLLRGQGTYWIGYGASGAATHIGDRGPGRWAKVQAWLNSDRTRASRTVVQRVGIIAVPLCYLTVGLQTAVLAAAGLVRIPWLKFTLAQLPGAAAWAAIYSTVGFAGWTAAVAAFTGTGWGWALLTIAVAAGVLLVVPRVGRRTLQRLDVSAGQHTETGISGEIPAQLSSRRPAGRWGPRSP
ncbi:MAG: DedA family protein [Nesterenkonia sp.]